MTKLTNLTLAHMRDGLNAKQFSATELARAHVEAIETWNPTLNAFIVTTPELALAAAKTADEKLAKGEARALEGIPMGMKDLFCTKGVQTTAASHILEGFKPPYESTVSQKLLDAGAVMLGKLNLDEFAMGSANMTSYFGPVVNPWGIRDSGLGTGKDNANPQAPSPNPLVPGGSSGGSAAAVSANLCAFATGTDTGGSIRQPAAFTGIVGIKPTYGRCSRYGIVAFASSLDQAGSMARNVRDAAISLKAMCGFDPKDSTSAHVEVPDFEAALGKSVKGLRIGIPKEYRPEGIDAELASYWDKGAEILKQLGADIVPISLPHTKYALATYYIIAPAEASSNLARYDGVRFGLRVMPEGGNLDDMYEMTRAEGFGHEVKRRILIGTYVLSAGYYDAYYKKAQKLRYLIADDFKKAFEKVDVILTPTAPSAAFGFDYTPKDPVEMYLNDVFTVPTSIAGLPGLSLPIGLNKNGLPLGLQLIGKAFDEATVLQAAYALEEAVGFNAKPEIVA